MRWAVWAWLEATQRHAAAKAWQAAHREPPEEAPQRVGPPFVQLLQRHVAGGVTARPCACSLYESFDFCGSGTNGPGESRSTPTSMLCSMMVKMSWPSGPACARDPARLLEGGPPRNSCKFAWQACVGTNCHAVMHDSMRTLGRYNLLGWTLHYPRNSSCRLRRHTLSCRQNGCWRAGAPACLPRLQAAQDSHKSRSGLPFNGQQCGAHHPWSGMILRCPHPYRLKVCVETDPPNDVHRAPHQQVVDVKCCTNMDQKNKADTLVWVVGLDGSVDVGERLRLCVCVCVCLCVCVMGGWVGGWGRGGKGGAGDRTGARGQTPAQKPKAWSRGWAALAENLSLIWAQTLQRGQDVSHHLLDVVKAAPASPGASRAAYTA